MLIIICKKAKRENFISQAKRKLLETRSAIAEWTEKTSLERRNPAGFSLIYVGSLCSSRWKSTQSKNMWKPSLTDAAP